MKPAPFNVPSVANCPHSNNGRGRRFAVCLRGYLFLFVAVTLLVGACTPVQAGVSDSLIQTAIAQTQAAEALLHPTATDTQRPTETPVPTQTHTPRPSSTPTITLTPTETATPTITLTPTATDTPTITLTPTASLTPTITLAPAVADSCVPDSTQRDLAYVNRVIDGDTIEVTINRQVYRVRYIGMDTPEYTTETEYYGRQATARNQALVEGKYVTLVKDVSETDKYDRLLRYVFIGELFVNYDLVRGGFANTTSYPPDVACQDAFLAAERQAREELAGFWRPTPTPAPTQPPVYVAPILPPGGGGGGDGGGGGGGGNCDPSYPGVCIPPPPPDLDCKDVPYRRFQVVGSDPHGFDGDGDGIGCES